MPITPPVAAMALMCASLRLRGPRQEACTPVCETSTGRRRCPLGEAAQRHRGRHFNQPLRRKYHIGSSALTAINPSAQA